LPRAFFAPFHLFSEYALRRPIGAVVVFAERHHLPERFLYFTSFGTYGTENEISLRPNVDFEWGVRTNAGATFTWKRRESLLGASFTIGGPDWLRVGLGDRLPLDARSTLAARADYERRGDLRFWGLGPSAPARGYHFTLTRPSTGLAYEQRGWRSSTFEAFAGFRTVAFQGWAPSTPRLETAIAAHMVETPPGFGGYSVAVQRLGYALDSRRPRAEPEAARGTDFVAPSGCGGRIEAHGQHAVALSGERGEWMRYGGGVGVYADLTGEQRTLGLSVSTELLTRLRNTEVPFTELVALGGTEPMRAYRYNRLLGTSSLVAKLAYTWPIWSGFDAVTEAALGNVFGDYYQGFATRLLRGSFSLGLQTTSARATAFQILIGAGTRTIDDGFGVEQLRFVVGTGTSF
jgi:hypothetical protein